MSVPTTVSSSNTQNAARSSTLVADLRRRSSDIADDATRRLLEEASSALERALDGQRTAERRVAEREKHMDLIEQIAGLGSWEIDIPNDLILWSREQRRIHGVPIEGEQQPATHTGFMQMVHPDDIAIVNEGMAELAKLEPVQVEFRIVRPDGEARLLQARGQLIPDASGAYTRVIGTSLDITERRATELALRASEESYRAIFQGASDAMWLHDVESGVILECNEAACDMMGYTAEEQKAIGLEGFTDAESGYTMDRAWDYARRAIAGEPQRFEWLSRHKDGSPVWSEMTLRHIKVRGVDRVHAMARGINARKAAEAALREANEELEQRVAARTAELAAINTALAQEMAERGAAERTLREREAHFRRIIESASDWVMICDRTGALTYVGPSAERMLGVKPEDVLGARPTDMLHPDDAPNAQRSLEWLMDHPGESLTTILRVRHKDGNYRTFEYIGRTLAPDSGDLGVIAFARDVTERTRAEEALARAKEEAERANRAKSEFLSRMSHELRTPMNSILGFGQLLARAELAPQQTKSVQHILKAGRHLLTLINEVLEISRIEAGRENFSLEPVALGPALHEAVALVRPLAQQYAVELREGIVPSGAFVQADRQRFVQVVLNLLSNAMKYNRPGGFVRLAVSGDDARWTIRVEDTGRGVSPDRVQELFTPFARLGAEQSDVEGTGLGLALSQRLCEAMGGALTLESTSPEGSTFRVDLPIAGDPVRAVEESGNCDVTQAPHRAATLLYVEDNLANLSLVETILLSRPGWRTVPALQGQLGVELAREYLPDVVLLDLHLPDMPGDEVLRRLRSDAATSKIPVIVVSADATGASLERLRTAGADAYLTKPLDVDEFLRVVERFLPE